MKSFHRLGTLAAAVFGIAVALLLWASFSGALAPHEQSNARLGLRLVIVSGIAFWGWYLREEQQRANPTRFTDDMPFETHLELLAAFDDEARVAASWLAPGQVAKAVLAVGEQGFEARLRHVDSPAVQRRTGGMHVAVQLLAPARALPVLVPGSHPRVFIEGGPVGTTRELSVAQPAR